MAKKPTAKPESSPSPTSIPAPARRARTPAGRLNKATPAARDATPLAPEPSPSAPPVLDDPATVTAPQRKAPSAKSKTALPSPAAFSKTPPKAKAKAASTSTSIPAPAMTSAPAPVTTPQKAADSLLKFAAKAVRLVGKKAAKMKQEAEGATSTKASPQRFAPAPKPVAKAPRLITEEEIAIRAYLLSEKRQQHGHHAEPHEDWAEAERQLQLEAAAE